MMYLLVALIGVLAILTLVIALQGKGRYSWVQFYARGKDAGFSMAEIAFLKKVAQQAGMEEPSALFWSVRQLDNCIKSISHSGGERPDDEHHEFLAKLYEYRKKIEFDQPRYRTGIKSSRFIAEGQRMKLLLQGRGVFTAQVIENGPKHLTVSYPPQARQAEGVFQNSKVSAYFWRQEDAGYVFDTYVLDELVSRGIPVLRLAHSDSLFRSQQRKSIRAKSKLPAYLYLLKRAEGAYEKPEKVPGMRCILQDLSEDGAAILIGGKAKPGLKVKIQFMVGESQAVMSGEVKGVEFSGDRKQSLMHMQALPPSPRMRNILLAYVFNLMEHDGEPQEAEELLDEPETLLEAGEEPAAPADAAPSAAPAAEGSAAAGAAPGARPAGERAPGLG